MLRHCRSIAVGAHVNSNKFEASGKDLRLLYAEGEVLGLADLKLALHVDKGKMIWFSPANNVVYKDVHICIIVDDNAVQLHHIFPGSVNILNEGDECGQAINGPKWHNIVSSFCCIWTGKGEFLLRLLFDPHLVQLMWLSGRPTLRIAEVGGSIPAKH